MAQTRVYWAARIGWQCRCLLAASSLLILVGCGGSDGPERYHLSGAVTYAGKPVPAGTVSFVPDSTKGNHGPGGSAPIKDGRFDTSEGTGHVGGPHIVTVTGLDGVATSDMPVGKSLFADYQIPIDLPKQDSTQDFDIPAERQGRRKPTR